MPPDNQEKTEHSTPRRKQKARKEGQVAKSTEIGSVLILFFGLCIIRYVGSFMFSQMKKIAYTCFSQSSVIQLNPNNVYSYFVQLLLNFFRILAPMTLGALVVALVANYAQVGFLITAEPLTPKPERINPIKGFSNLFSKKTFVELAKSVLKISIIGYIAYRIISGEFTNFASLAGTEISDIVRCASRLTFKIGVRVSLALFVLALLDYAYQRWEHEQQLKMTKEEAKEELRETEGDPLIKARIRSVQQRMAMNRMIAEVPKADVIITNPHLIAVALLYDVSRMEAPMMIAKGARLIAERIKEIARENDIPIMENKPLAQILYKAVETGQEIPITMYQAVAEMLAYVYRLKGKTRSRK